MFLSKVRKAFLRVSSKKFLEFLRLDSCFLFCSNFLLFSSLSHLSFSPLSLSLSHYPFSSCLSLRVFVDCNVCSKLRRQVIADLAEHLNTKSWEGFCIQFLITYFIDNSIDFTAIQSCNAKNYLYFQVLGLQKSTYFKLKRSWVPFL